MFSCLLLSFVAYHQFSNLATKSSRGRRCSADVLLSSPVLCGLPSILNLVIQDRSRLEEANAESKEKRRCSCRANARFVSLRLAEGRRPKGRGSAWRRSLPYSNNQIVEQSNLTTFRPTRCRALSSGGTPLGKPASGSWSAPVGATRRYYKNARPRVRKSCKRFFPRPTATIAPLHFRVATGFGIIRGEGKH